MISSFFRLRMFIIHQYFHVSLSPQIVWDRTVASPPAVGVSTSPLLRRPSSGSNWYLRRALYRIPYFIDDLNACRDRHIYIQVAFHNFIACILQCFKILYSTAPVLLYNSGRPLNAGNERVCSLSGNSLSCLNWSSVMPSTMSDPSDPGVTTSISLISRHAVFGFFQYEKG